MKKLLPLTIITLLSCSSVSIFTRDKNKTEKMVAAPAILFTAEDGSTGQYWEHNHRAILGEEEYCKVVTINKKQLNAKSARKSKKGKEYLGSFVDESSAKTYYIYGVIKNPAPLEETPDSDVRTEIAIKIDYGPGE